MSLLMIVMSSVLKMSNYLSKGCIDYLHFCGCCVCYFFVIFYDCNLDIMLAILARLIEFVFSLVLTQFQNFTSSMAMAKVGDHGCDAWTFLMIALHLSSPV